MHAEQAAEGPHHIDRPRAVAERTGGGTEAEHESEREGEHQHQPRPPLPAPDRLRQPLAASSTAARRSTRGLEIARDRARLGVRARLVERRMAFFVTADEPASQRRDRNSAE